MMIYGLLKEKIFQSTGIMIWKSAFQESVKWSFRSTRKVILSNRISSTEILEVMWKVIVFVLFYRILQSRRVQFSKATHSIVESGRKGYSGIDLYDTDIDFL